MYEPDKVSRCRESEIKFGGKLVRLSGKRTRVPELTAPIDANDRGIPTPCMFRGSRLREL